MQKPMTGVRVLEVAQFTFVPSAGAVLADWGADVIKIENPVTGDGQRGLVTVGGRSATAPGVAFAPIIEAPNRGKRSIGLSLALNQSRPVFEELVRRSDVFLTNYLPQARSKLRIELDEIRRINPSIIYVAGSGFGSEGPDRDTGAHDVTAFWARSGSADGVTATDSETATGMPAGGYGDKTLFKGVDLRVGRGQRIGIVGPNGAGKSTLLKLIAGRMEPLRGRVERGHGAICAYYDQDTSHLRGDHTAAEELRRHYPGMTDQEVRDHLARFLFRGEEIEKLVSLLSGGERARLSLAILVLSQPSWFALDEPTNHLDLASRTALEEMLGEFQGAIICISHDRAFLDGITNTTYEVGGGVVREFEGNYSAWRAAKDAEDSRESEERAKRESAARKAAAAAEAKKLEQQKKQQQQAPRAAGGGAPAAKPAAAAPAANNKKKGPRNPYMFEKLEQRIMQLEGELKALHDSMVSEAVYSNPDRLKETQIRVAEVEAALELANEEWLNWES